MRNCKNEVKQSVAISYVRDYYVHLGESLYVELLESDWPNPLTYCEPYYFGFDI